MYRFEAGMDQLSSRARSCLKFCLKVSARELNNRCTGHCTKRVPHPIQWNEAPGWMEWMQLAQNFTFQMKAEAGYGGGGVCVCVFGCINGKLL